MTLTEHALRGSVLRAGPDRRLRVGLPWYRGMPYSALAEVTLTVDGRRADGLQLDVDGSWVDVAALGAVRGPSWFLQDRHELRWAASDSLGERASVVLGVRLRLPNLLGPDGGTVQVLQEVSGEVPVEVDG